MPSYKDNSLAQEGHKELNIQGRCLWEKSIRNIFLACHARIQLTFKQRLGRTIQLKKLWSHRIRPKQTKQTKISRRDLIQKWRTIAKINQKSRYRKLEQYLNWKAWEVIPSPKCKHALQLCPDPAAGCNSLPPCMQHPGFMGKEIKPGHRDGTHSTPQSIPALTHQWSGFQLPCKTIQHPEKVWCRFLGSCRYRRQKWYTFQG